MAERDAESGDALIQFLERLSGRQLRHARGHSPLPGGNDLFNAIQKSGVPHVVDLGSIGAQPSDGAGPINGLHDNEQRLNGLKGVNVLHLRPTYFLENLLMQVDIIRNMGMAGSR